MSFEVLLPQWGFEMTEGTIGAWLKQVGDEVVEGDDLVEIETDKITTIIEALTSGTLAQILVQTGETVPIRTVLAVIAEPGDA